MALKHKRNATNPHPRPLQPVVAEPYNSCQNSPGLQTSTSLDETSDDTALFPQEAPGLRHIHNFFQLLHLSMVSGPVCVEIPETLFVTEGGRDALLFNDEKKSVRLYESGDVVSQFFVQCTQRYSSSETAPQYIFTSLNSGYKVLFDESEAEKLWKSSREHTKLMQRYIVPNSAEPSKLRIIWSRTGEVKRYRIHKKTLSSVFKGRKMPRSNSYNALTSSFKYDLCAFSHAGQLKKSSFSPYLPFKSVLFEELSQKHSARSSPARATPKTANEPFLVSSRQQGDYTLEVIAEPIPKAERMSQPIREVLAHFLVAEDDIIESLGYDVIQGATGDYYLLNAKWMVTGKKPEPPTVTIEAERCTTPEQTHSGPSLRKKFSKVMLSVRSETVIPKAPFIDLKDIQCASARNYVSKLPTLQGRTPPAASCPIDRGMLFFRDSLDHAQTKLDSLVNAAMEHRAKNRVVEKVKLEKYSEKMLEHVLNKVYERVRMDTTLRDFFNGKSKGEINMIKQGFSKAFTGVDNYYFKRSVKKIHEGMGISSKAFHQFVEIFIVVMREEGVCSEDIDTVHNHLQMFFDEVVEDEQDEITE